MLLESHMEILDLFFVSCWENHHLYRGMGGQNVCMLVVGIMGM